MRTQRVDDLRELWRAELRRVEDIAATKLRLLTERVQSLEARVKHLEERRSS